MELFNKKNYLKNGYEVIENVIPSRLIKEFKREIKLFTKNKAKYKNNNKKKEDDFSNCLKNYEKIFKLEISNHKRWKSY